MVAKLSSVTTILAALLATSVPVMPMATPTSARASAGASLTPSPVIATTSPRACSAWTMRSFCAGCTRAKTAMRSSSSRSSASPRRSSSGPSTARSPPQAMPSSRAIASPVSLWSPVSISGRMPASRARATATFTSWRGGSICPTSPSSRALPASASNPASGSSGSSSTAAKASTRSARPAMASTAVRTACAEAVPCAAHSRSTASGEPLTRMRRGASASRWRVAINWVSESKGSSASRGAFRGSAARSIPALWASTSRAASVGSPSTVHAPRSSFGGSNWASLHSAAASSRSRSAGSAWSHCATGCPASRSAPSGA